MGCEKPVVSVRLDPELIKEIKIIAKKENRSLSNMVETILINYVNLTKDKD